MDPDRELENTAPFDLLSRGVGELVRREPVIVDLGLEPSAADVARAMDAADVDAVLLAESGSTIPVGILTDRDLRSRVLARDLGPDVAARKVMTSPVETIAAAATGTAALLQLLRTGRHHLVVERGGRAVGIVTSSDLLHHRLRDPARVLETVRSAESFADLAKHPERLAATVQALAESGIAPLDVGRVAAVLGDALVDRILTLATGELTAEHGPAPCPWAWIVTGSEGRREQSFLTDRDDALVYRDDTPAARTWFERLARRAGEGLTAAGVPECPGGFMASNWCDPLDVWCTRFERWIESPDPGNLLRLVTFLDWRVVAGSPDHGSLDLTPLEDVVRGAATNRLFLAHLARSTARLRPPLGLFHRLVARGGGLDLKAGALMPVAGLARLFALEAGARGGSTLGRLDRARDAGIVSADGARLLAEAFRYAFGLRLRRQLADRRAGRPPSNTVPVGELTTGERRHLEGAFREIARMQEATVARLGTGIPG